MYLDYILYGTYSDPLFFHVLTDELIFFEFYVSVWEWVWRARVACETIATSYNLQYIAIYYQTGIDSAYKSINYNF